MTDRFPASGALRIREAIAEIAALRADGDRSTERFVSKTRDALAEAQIDRDRALESAVESRGDESEWTKLIEELETRLSDASAAERAAREATRQVTDEVQELRRAKRDLERDCRAVRHELENLKASLEEDGEDRDIARRELATANERLEQENRRLQSEIAAMRGPVPPPGPDAEPDDGDESEEPSEVRDALRSLGKKRGR